MSQLRKKSTSRSQSQNKKEAKNKKRSTKSTKQQKPKHDKTLESSLSSLIEQFDSLFIEKDAAPDKKKLKEFARSSLILKEDNDEDTSSINYRNPLLTIEISSSFY